MQRSFLLAQLTDTHIGATWGPANPVAGLTAVLESIGELGAKPHAVVITGDLGDDGTDAEYEQLAQLVAGLDIPVFALAGNHDDRARLRGWFGASGLADGTAGADHDPFQYAVDLGPLRLIALDTKRIGSDGGGLDRGCLRWLDRELANDPDKPVLLALHHPPLVTGIPAFDEIGLAVADQRALGDVVAGHPQVRGLVCGHVHRAITGSLAGRPVVVVPSTFAAIKLRVGSRTLEFAPDPRGFALHTLLDGDLVSQIEIVRAATE